MADPDHDLHDTVALAVAVGISLLWVALLIAEAMVSSYSVPTEVHTVMWGTATFLFGLPALRGRG